MTMNQHKSLLRKKLKAYDTIESTKKAIREDEEIQSLFETGDEEDETLGYEIMDRKYGGYPSVESINKALIELMQAIFFFTKLRNIDHDTVYANYKVCMEAIETTRKFFK